MKRISRIIFVFCLFSALMSGAKAGEPVPVIFDTDMGNDVDDVIALDLLFKYQDEGKINLLALMSSKIDKGSAEFLDLMKTWYGYSKIPIGVVRHGASGGNEPNYGYRVWQMKDGAGKPLFKTTTKDFSRLPDAHTLYRKILSRAADNSVVVISVGFSTNLARLLLTGADQYSSLTGRELVAKKVKYFSLMAGGILNPVPEYNVKIDIPSAQMLFSLSPVPIVTSPFDVGNQVKYPAAAIENNFGWAPVHPLVEAYKAYMKMPYDRPMWDPTAVIEGVFPGQYMSASERGTITIDHRGVMTFTPGSDGLHRYLKITPEQAARLKQYIVDVTTKKPKHFNNK